MKLLLVSVYQNLLSFVQSSKLKHFLKVAAAATSGLYFMSVWLQAYFVGNVRFIKKTCYLFIHTELISPLFVLCVNYVYKTN